MKFYIYVDDEKKGEVTATGYLKAAEKAKKKYDDFKVYREDDPMPKPKPKKKIEVELKTEGEENDIHE